MKDATHFIEIWKRHDTGKVEQGKIQDIANLTIAKETTMILGHKTICVWKLTFKKKQHDRSNTKIH